MLKKAKAEAKVEAKTEKNDGTTGRSVEMVKGKVVRKEAKGRKSNLARKSEDDMRNGNCLLFVCRLLKQEMDFARTFEPDRVRSSRVACAIACGNE